MNPLFMDEAIRLSRESMHQHAGGPFGAVIVRQGQIIAQGWNQVVPTVDPTAHAEVVAIRAACATLKTFHLEDCDLYSSCEPCPMCLAAIYWARIGRLFFANTRKDAAAIGFDDELLYTQLPLPIHERLLPTQQLMRAQALDVFAEWKNKPGKIAY